MVTDAILVNGEAEGKERGEGSTLENILSAFCELLFKKQLDLELRYFTFFSGGEDALLIRAYVQL